MQRFVIAGFAVLVLVSASTAKADWSAKWHYFWYTVKRDYHRNVMWPEPFIHNDRASTLAPLAMQVERGWEMQNLLNEHHFDPQTGELNRAGREKLHSVLVRAPEPHRTVFVQHGESAEHTDARVESVTQFASTVMPDRVPAVERTHLRERNFSASEIHQLQQRYYSGLPEPKLPESSQLRGIPGVAGGGGGGR